MSYSSLQVWEVFNDLAHLRSQILNFVNDGNSKPVWIASPFVGLYGIIYFHFDQESLGVLIPVAVCVQLSLMGITAVGRLGRTNEAVFNLVFLGALLFIL